MDVNDDWTLAQTLFGVTTYYRREDDGSLSIKLEGQLDGVPLFEQVAVLREVDLHHKWAPFVSSSLTVAHLDKLDTVGWFVVGLPNFGLMRDACFRAIGCDCMAEDGSILLVGQGIADRPEDNKNYDEDNDDENNNITTNAKHQSAKAASPKSASEGSTNDSRYLAIDPALKELDLPDVPQRMGSGRMTIRSFNGIIHVESPTSVRTRLIANVDPNLSFLPQSLLEFVMKKMCGVLLSKLQSAAKRITKDPVRNAHARKMRLEREFYHSWLIPKFEGQCKRHDWIMPPVSAFNLTEEQQEQERAYEEQKRIKGNSKLIHSLDDLDKVDRHAQHDEGSGRSEPVGYGYNPQSPTSYDSDTVSELSMNSSTTIGSAWRNNPLANYLRDLEEKTQRRKEEEICRSRERAAKRLKPKVLDPTKQSRLAELRAAKNRRRLTDSRSYSRGSSSLSGGGSSLCSSSKEAMNSSGREGEVRRSLPPKLVVTDLTTSQRQLVVESRRTDLAILWTEHGAIMRVLVTSILMGLLFSALYKETFFGISARDYLFTLRETETGPWYMGIARDAGTIGYLSGLALIHFCLCYVSLMYAFSALQLGDIAGRHAKKFYSRNIHVLVAAASGSMVFLGVIKAWLMVGVRLLVWRSVWLFGATKELGGEMIGVEQDGLVMTISETLSPVWAAFTSFINLAVLPIYHMIRLAANSVILVLSGLHRVLFQSNSVGQLLESIVISMFHGVTSTFSIWNVFVNDVVDRYEGRQAMLSWREDAFRTTRILLSYSAVFLLTLLLLFNLSAKNARKETDNGTADGAVVSPSSAASNEKVNSESVTSRGNVISSLASPSPSTSSMSVPRSATPMMNRKRAPTFDSIAEDEPFYDAFENDDTAGENFDTTNTTTPSSITSKTSMSSKIRRGFRLRRRRRSSRGAGSAVTADDSRIGRSRTHSL